MNNKGPLRYQEPYWPRCAKCGRKLHPAPTARGNYCGFSSCPLHPRGKVVYPPIPSEQGQ